MGFSIAQLQRIASHPDTHVRLVLRSGRLVEGDMEIRDGMVQITVPGEEPTTYTVNPDHIEMLTEVPWHGDAGSERLVEPDVGGSVHHVAFDASIGMEGRAG